MTFKPNIPERWFEKPEHLPANSLVGNVGKETHIESKEFDPMQMTDRKAESFDKGEIELLRTRSFGGKTKSFSFTQTQSKFAEAVKGGQLHLSFGKSLGQVEAESQDGKSQKSKSHTNRERNAAEVAELDQFLKKYSPYKDYENQKDKEKRLKNLMENAENFAVAQAQHKKHLGDLNFRKSFTLPSQQPSAP